MFRRKLFVIVGVSVCVLALGMLVLCLQIPSVSILSSHYPVVEKKNHDTPVSVVFVKSRPYSWIHLHGISHEAVGAIVVSEDWAFFNHSGYDFSQIREAFIENVSKGKYVRGASTITQQVARNLFFSKEKRLWRKFKELIVAHQLEKYLSKREILEIYVNIAEWGKGIYGIGQASAYYFSKHPSELTAKEGAFLAMLLPNPKHYSSSYRKGELTQYAKSTIRSILAKMAQAHYLTKEQAQEALDDEILFRKS